MSKIAMFGGSFNPVHNGHVGLVQRMIERFSLDTVYVIPTHHTPLKDNTPMVTAEHRFNMCTLAFADIPKVKVSNMEILRKGKSYTVDTLRELHSIHPDCELYLIMGADSFMQLSLWYEVAAIFSLATILTVSRGEVDFDELNRQKRVYESDYGAKVHIVSEPIAQVSSTEIRTLISSGGNFNHLLGSGVSEYIIKNGLYDYGD